MEKGLKNLGQAFHSAQKKLENGTYHHEDSGIEISDLEDEPYVEYREIPDHYPYAQQAQRVPSIQSMLHPMPLPYPRTRQVQRLRSNPCPSFQSKFHSEQTVPRQTATSASALYHATDHQTQEEHNTAEGLTAPLVEAEEVEYTFLDDSPESEPACTSGEKDHSSPRSTRLEPGLDFGAYLTTGPGFQTRSKDICNMKLDQLQGTSDLQALPTSPPETAPTNLTAIDHTHAVDTYKEEMLDRLMIHFYDLFAAGGFTTRNGHTGSSSSSSPQQSIGVSQQHVETCGKKRTSDEMRRNGEQDDDGNEDGSRKHPKKLDGLAGPSQDQETRLACPYFKRDSHKHRTSRACSGPGFLTVAKVKYRQFLFLPCL
jgi:hypothetical protein